MFSYFRLVSSARSAKEKQSWSASGSRPSAKRLLPRGFWNSRPPRRKKEEVTLSMLVTSPRRMPWVF
jgi:hypothetical protein